MTLQLKKFDMKSITFRPDQNTGPVIVMIGRRDTGKSFLVRDLLYYHVDIFQCVDFVSKSAIQSNRLAIVLVYLLLLQGTLIATLISTVSS